MAQADSVHCLVSVSDRQKARLNLYSYRLPHHTCIFVITYSYIRGPKQHNEHYARQLRHIVLIQSPVFPSDGISAPWWRSTLAPALGNITHTRMRSCLSFTTQTDSLHRQTFWHPLWVNSKIWTILCAPFGETRSFKSVSWCLSRRVMWSINKCFTAIFCICCLKIPLLLNGLFWPETDWLLMVRD